MYGDSVDGYYFSWFLDSSEIVFRFGAKTENHKIFHGASELKFCFYVENELEVLELLNVEKKIRYRLSRAKIDPASADMPPR